MSNIDTHVEIRCMYMKDGCLPDTSSVSLFVTSYICCDRYAASCFVMISEISKDKRRVFKQEYLKVNIGNAMFL